MGHPFRTCRPREKPLARALDRRPRAHPASGGRRDCGEAMTEERLAFLDGIAAPQSRRLDETRTLIAIGDPARERVVLQLLAESVEDGPPLRLVRRCLDSEDLLGSVQAGDVDAAIKTEEHT